MTPTKQAFLQRVMAPPQKIFGRPTKVFQMFDGDPIKMSQYLIYEAHHGDERVNSTIHYGPMRDSEGNVMFTERRNPAKRMALGKHHVHHFLTFTFKN